MVEFSQEPLKHFISPGFIVLPLPSISFKFFPLSLTSEAAVAKLSTPSLETLVALATPLLIGFLEHLSNDPPVPLLVKVGPIVKVCLQLLG